MENSKNTSKNTLVEMSGYYEVRPTGWTSIRAVIPANRDDMLVNWTFNREIKLTGKSSLIEKLTRYNGELLYDNIYWLPVSVTESKSDVNEYWIRSLNYIRIDEQMRKNRIITLFGTFRGNEYIGILYTPEVENWLLKIKNTNTKPNKVIKKS